MELLGSGGSPYVRRIRLVLGDYDHVFTAMNIYGPDREALRRENPVLKIPTLIDDGLTLFDSRIIYRYLAERLGLAPLDWAEENAVTVADGANDAAVVLRLSAVSGLSTTSDTVMYHRIQRERMRECIDWLEQQAAQGRFEAWRFPAICVYCMVDWLSARGLFDFAGHPALWALLARYADRPMVTATDPRDSPPPEAG